jgi:hypothetical protein
MATLKVPGLPAIPLVSADETELADFVVCARRSPAVALPGNVEAQCALCGAVIVHRPYMPKRPMKMCLECFLAKELSLTQ